MIVGFRNDSMAICELMNWMGIEARKKANREGAMCGWGGHIVGG
jgi:hypothetical protein